MDINVCLSLREKKLILAGLGILEDRCIGDELHYDLVDELGGTPDDEEVRALMDKLDSPTPQ